MSDLSSAISLMGQAFEGRYDKSGKPYALHCYTVMANLPFYDEELAIIAILHDLIEDTNYTLNCLKNMGYSQRVLDGLSLLTHEKGQSYDQYIKGIGTNVDAILVKMADLRHNSDILRLKGVSEKDTKRIVKYHKSFMYLKEILNEQYPEINLG